MKPVLSTSAVILSVSSVCCVAEPVILIRGAAIVDVTSGSIRPHQDIEIRGQRIVVVGTNLPIANGPKVVEASGLFVIPGLWDFHVHLAGQDPIAQAPEALVGYGITGVRDMGGRTAKLVALRSSIESGERLGPTMVMAGPTLNGAQNADFHRVVSSPEEASKAVNEVRAAGADFIKVHNALTPPTFFAICQAAAQANLPVVGHIPHGLGTLEASNAGMKSIEHVEVLMEAELYLRDGAATGIADALERISADRGHSLFKAIAIRETAFTPTLSAYRAFVDSQSKPEDRQLGERVYARLAKVVKIAHEAGVVVLAGTDYRVGPGESLHAELKLLVTDSGLAAIDALRAATVNPTKFLGLTDQGKLKPGDVANLVLLEANPLDDITNTTRIAGVVLRGRYLDGETLRKLRENKQ